MRGTYERAAWPGGQALTLEEAIAEVLNETRVANR
jgi:hypothetical protein